jgi:NAD(P)-dependent dehydrogenase (short-subunit alcohol dehydrogenase family)
LTAFAKVLACELSNKKIRVNIISPGLVSTNLINKISTISNVENNEHNNYPLGIGTVNNVSDQVIHLLSDRSKWMTGTDILIDGGFTLK